MSSELERKLLMQIAAVNLPAPEVEARFHPVRRWRFDLAWRPQKLAVEVDGGSWVSGRHNRGAGFEADCEKLNTAALMGWRVLRFTGGMVRDGRALAAIQEALA